MTKTALAALKLTMPYNPYGVLGAQPMIDLKPCPTFGVIFDPSTGKSAAYYDDPMPFEAFAEDVLGKGYQPWHTMMLARLKDANLPHPHRLIVQNCLHVAGGNARPR